MKNLKRDDDLNQIVNEPINNIPSSPFEDEMPTKLLLVQQISQKYEQLNINPNDINFKNIISDVTKLDFWNQLSNNLEITISNINASYLYQGFSGLDMINNYEVGFKKPIIEILYYPFILSVISNIVRYFSKNIEVINSDECIHGALNIITVIKQLIDSEKISIRKDGYFAKIINSWELDNIETLVKLQKYDHHTLLSDYYDIKYEDLYYGNILKLDEKVK